MNLDLQDPTNFKRGLPYEIFDYLRENDPVHWQSEGDSGPGYWVLTRYDDIKEVELDDATFSHEPEVGIATGASFGDDVHKNLLASDPPHHTEHRDWLAKDMGMTRIRPARESMRELVNSIIDDVIETGEADLVEDLAGKMASFAIADLMGLDRKESVEMFHAASIIAATLAKGSNGMDYNGAIQVLQEHGMRAWEEHAVVKKDTMLGRLAQGSINGVPYDQIQFLYDYMLLVAAGSDTSRNALSMGMMTLFEHPEVLQDIADDPRVLTKVIEELLRFNPPVVAIRRNATRDVELRGTQIKKGDKVVVYYGAANRDPAVFENPNEFNYKRGTNPHVTFGSGRHHCLGAHLARLELTTMFGAMLERMPDMQLAGEPTWPEASSSPQVVGPLHAPVKFTPGTKVVQGEVAAIFA